MNLEDIVTLMNAYPPLWAIYVLVLTAPLVGVIAYFFWPQEEDKTAYHKKTDEASPDDKYKDEVQDSGIEASGASSERDISPDSIQATRLKSNDRSHDKSHDSNAEITPSKENEQVSRQNGTWTEHSDSNTGSDANLQNGLMKKDEVEEEKEEEGEEEEEDEKEDRRRWSFPPVLDEFDLMATDKDPSELEDMFSDERLTEVTLTLEDDGPGLGITIVGGSGSPNGDLPILVKRVIPGSLAEQEGTIKAGDELVAINETLLAGVRKDYAVQAFSKLEGDVRLLILQDD